MAFSFLLDKFICIIINATPFLRVVDCFFLNGLSLLLGLLAAVVAHDHVEVRQEAASAEDDVGIFQPLVVDPRLLHLLPLDRHVVRDYSAPKEQVSGPRHSLHIHAEVD